MCLIAGIMLKNISVRESLTSYQKFRQTNFFQEKLWQMFLNWALQSKELNPENFNTSAITLKQHSSKQELHGGNHRKLST